MLLSQNKSGINRIVLVKNYSSLKLKQHAFHY